MPSKIGSLAPQLLTFLLFVLLLSFFLYLFSGEGGAGAPSTPPGSAPEKSGDRIKSIEKIISVFVYWCYICLWVGVKGVTVWIWIGVGCNSTNMSRGRGNIRIWVWVWIHVHIFTYSPYTRNKLCLRYPGGSTWWHDRHYTCSVCYILSATVAC